MENSLPKKHRYATSKLLPIPESKRFYKGLIWTSFIPWKHFFNADPSAHREFKYPSSSSSSNFSSSCCRRKACAIKAFFWSSVNTGSRAGAPLPLSVSFQHHFRLSRFHPRSPAAFYPILVPSRPTITPSWPGPWRHEIRRSHCLNWPPKRCSFLRVAGREAAGPWDRPLWWRLSSWEIALLPRGEFNTIFHQTIFKCDKNQLKTTAKILRTEGGQFARGHFEEKNRGSGIPARYTETWWKISRKTSRRHRKMLHFRSMKPSA